MPPVVPLLIAGAEMAGGFAAATAIGASTFAEIVGGLSMIGGALTAVGDLTGNSTLMKIGGIVGTVGGVGMGVGALTGALTEASGAAVSSMADASGATSAAQMSQEAAGAATTSADTATAGATGTGAANANVAGNGAINSAGPAADTANATAAANSPLAGTPGAPVTPQAMGTAQDTTTSLAHPGQDLANVGPNTVSGTPSGPLSAVKDWYSSLTPTGKLEAIKTGSGILQGVMGYIAPSPMDRAKMNELNASMDKLHWEQSLAAQHNAALAGMKPGTPPAGQATWGPQNAPVNAAPAAPAATGYQPANVSQMMPQIGNLNAVPGILQSNMQPQG